MDPYLEHPAIFPDLHDSMVAYLRESLQARLPAPYFADIGSRVWVDIAERSIGPDVNVLRGERTSARPGSPDGGRNGGAVAVATPTRSQPIVVTVPHDEFRETYVQIFAKLENERLVTSIEVLSLSNKTRGQHGRELYLRKQQEIPASDVHLVEIDLLRSGEHTTAVPRDRAVKKAGQFDYHVCIHHFDNLEDYFVYAIRLEDRLPEIAIPLLPGDAAVPIDLQAVFDRCYETGPYVRRVRYNEIKPEPPLNAEQSNWAAGLLRASPR
jgi:hypothetical protein